MAEIVKTQEVDIDLLKPYERNSKKHGKEQIEKLKNSIREFGFLTPCVIDADYNLIAGHGRVSAAKELHMKKVPCVFVEGLTDAQRRAYVLADNRLGELGEWDMDMVNLELAELDALDFDITLTGFELPDFNDGDEAPIETEEDEMPEDVEARTKLGDIWQLGEHRLICGDSTDKETVRRLMDGHKAKILFTSPPYSDMREYNGGKDLSVDNISKFIPAYRDYTDYQCVNLGIQRRDHEIYEYWNEYIKSARDCGYKLLAWNVWNKMDCGSIGQHTAFIPICHEWIFVFGVEFFDINKTWDKKEESIREETTKCTQRQKDGTVTRRTHGDMSDAKKKMESVLSLLPEKHNSIRQLHPATFPVGLPAEYIKSMTNVGDAVIEPFGGSGTTLIACEQLHRKCYMCELDTHYCDVIIQRWENLTSRKAVLVD